MSAANKTRALVIDDEQIVLDSVKKILAQEGFDVDMSSSGRTGLDLAIKNIYDVVLTDIRMPEIGGMRILRDVKRARPSVPVVIMTGYATVQSAVRAMKLGATDYIEKPFTLEELVQAVKAAIDVAKVSAPEEQKVVHKKEVLRVLDRAGTDMEFAGALFLKAADALEEYDLTSAEKLAILTADITWLEEHVGKLTEKQKRWLEQKLSAEIW
jgi:DNA-binding NtrC family response regulator